jgi:hypothetical protein
MDEESLTCTNQSVRDTGRVPIGSHYDQFDPGDDFVTESTLSISLTRAAHA